MSKVWVLQHHRCEPLGLLADILEIAGITPHHVHLCEGQPVPKGMGGAGGLIVMGGPMGVYDHSRYPFLADEMRLIGQALRAEKPVLGICLGSQLLAATLGAPVTKGKKKEIGWYPVFLTESARTDRLWAGIEPSFVAYHWHGDVFELPKGAISLASSDLTACQAFHDRRKAYGLLFHMEVTPKVIQDMVDTFAEELREAQTDGHAIVQKEAEYLSRLQSIGRLVFRRWASLVEGETS